jgi:hypothetical protein
VQDAVGDSLWCSGSGDLQRLPSRSSGSGSSQSGSEWTAAVCAAGQGGNGTGCSSAAVAFLRVSTCETLVSGRPVDDDAAAGGRHWAWRVIGQDTGLFSSRVQDTAPKTPRGLRRGPIASEYAV